MRTVTITTIPELDALGTNEYDKDGNAFSTCVCGGRVYARDIVHGRSHSCDGAFDEPQIDRCKRGEHRLDTRVATDFGEPIIPGARGCSECGWNTVTGDEKEPPAKPWIVEA